jgi:hypothetical protein
MGKIPMILAAILALWIAVTVAREGPEKAFGGLFALLGSPQYGEADAPTRSGNIADRAEDRAAQKPADSKPAWWADR